MIKIKPQHHASEFGLIGIGSQTVAERRNGLLPINTALSVLLKPTVQRENAQTVPSWGAMISEGLEGIRSYPHLILAPATAMTLTVLAFNFVGDGLRDAFDPKLQD